MDISFDCERCGQHIVIDEAGAGQTVQCPACGANLTVPLLTTEATAPALSAALPSQQEPDFEPPTEKQIKFAKSLGIQVTPSMSKWDLCYEIDVVKIGVEAAERKREYYRRKRTGEKHQDEWYEWLELRDEFILAVYREGNQLIPDVLFVREAAIDVDEDCVFLHVVRPELIKDKKPFYLHWGESSAFRLRVDNLFYHKKVTRKFRIKGLELPADSLYDLDWYMKTFKDGQAIARQIIQQSQASSRAQAP